MQAKRGRTLKGVIDGKTRGNDAQSLIDKYDRLIEEAELEFDESTREIPEPEQLGGTASRLREDPAGAWRPPRHRGKLALQAFLFP